MTLLLGKKTTYLIDEKDRVIPSANIPPSSVRASILVVLNAPETRGFTARVKNNGFNYAFPAHSLTILLSRVSRRRASSLPFLGAEDDLLCREQLSIDLAFGRTQPD
jgi:hypothetical protein